MKRRITFLLLIFLPCMAANAVVQSFFVSRGIIVNGAILRGYNLEYGKEAPAASADLAALTIISGSVTVSYSGGKVQQTDLGELVRKNAVTMVPHGSSGHIGFIVNDKSITQMVIGPEGIGFFRETMTAYEKELTKKNILSIIELEQQGLVHSGIQEYIDRNRIIKTSAGDHRLTMDFQTTEKDSEKVKGFFNNSATVSLLRDGRIFLRLDGLLNRNSELSAFISELLTHYHSDHINAAAVEKCIRDGSYRRFIAPWPYLDASKVKAFTVLSEKAGFKDGGAVPAGRIIDIAPNGKTLNLAFTAAGDFLCSAFQDGGNITVEMFRYDMPRDVNSDGLIYRVSHKNVSYLLFGDFDDPEGIDQILDLSAANEQRRIDILEEKSELTVRLIQARAHNDAAAISEIQGKLQSLDNDLSGLVILKADVIKWPHHAHKFPNNETANNIIKKMNEVIDPYYIIWQRHYTQRGFTDYIQRFDFSGKFFCSDETEIEIISMPGAQSTLNLDIAALSELMLA